MWEGGTHDPMLTPKGGFTARSFEGVALENQCFAQTSAEDCLENDEDSAAGEMDKQDSSRSRQPQFAFGICASCVLVVALFLVLAQSWTAGGSTGSNSFPDTAGQREPSKVHQCSATDYSHLVDFQAGDAQPFFYNMSDCGIWHSISGGFYWVQDNFVGCMQTRHSSMLSKECLGCYSENAEYAFHHCKFPCLSWCSPLCITCTSQNQKPFEACIGKPVAQLPSVNSC